VITDFIGNKRVVSVNYLNGAFAFHEADTNDILRLLDEIQKGNIELLYATEILVAVEADTHRYFILHQ